jgi:hypothetical protein
LKERRSAGIDTLLLREQERGSFSIAREWTDWADPSPYGALGLPQRRLDADSLFELAALVDRLTKPEKPEQKEAAEFQRQEAHVATPEQKAQVLALARDLPRLWHASTTQSKDRKRMLRLLIKDITVEKPANQK